MKNKLNHLAQKGGVIINEGRPDITRNKDESEIFLHFLNKCTMARVVSDSSVSGILVHVFGCPDNESPYLSIRYPNDLQPVTSCILKLNIVGLGFKNTTYLSVIHKNNIIGTPLIFERRYNGDRNIEIQSRSSFMNEIINTQTIFRSSFKAKQNDGVYLQPICPSIIMYNFNINDEPNSTNLTSFIQLLQSKIGSNPYLNANEKTADFNVLANFKTLIHNLNEHLNDTHKSKVKFNLGFSCQEMMEGYNTLGSFENDPRYATYNNYAKFQLIRLGMNQNILHADAHRNNVMINPNIQFLYNEGPPGNVMIPGYPIIIDFGRITELKRDYYVNISLDPSLQQGTSEQEQLKIKKYIFLNYYYSNNNIVPFLQNLPRHNYMTYPKWGREIDGDTMYKDNIKLIQKQSDNYLDHLAARFNKTLDEIRKSIDDVNVRVSQADYIIDDILQNEQTQQLQPQQHQQQIQQPQQQLQQQIEDSAAMDQVQDNEYINSKLANTGDLQDFLADNPDLFIGGAPGLNIIQPNTSVNTFSTIEKRMYDNKEPNISVNNSFKYFLQKYIEELTYIPKKFVFNEKYIKKGGKRRKSNRKTMKKRQRRTMKKGSVRTRRRK